MTPATASESQRAARRASIGAAIVLALACGLAMSNSGAWRPVQAVPVDAVRLRLNPNVATREELGLLPDIGPSLADRIVAYRAMFAPGQAFRSLDDIDRVPGIGPVRLEALRPLLRFD